MSRQQTSTQATTDAFGEGTSDPAEAQELLTQAKNQAESDPMPRMDAFDVMVEISNAIPTSVTHDIEELDMQRGHVRIQGVVSSTADASLVKDKISEHRCTNDAKIGKITQMVNSTRQKYVLEFDVKCPEDAGAKKKTAANETETGASKKPERRGARDTMSLADRLRGLEERERRLLGILVAMVVGALVLLPPAALYALVHSRRERGRRNPRGHSGHRGRARHASSVPRRARARSNSVMRVRRRRSRRSSLGSPPKRASKSRKVRTARPCLTASASTSVRRRSRLRKVGLLKLVKFLEKIEHSGHPVRISQFDIRKRGSEPDSYDVDIVVSAFDRKAEPKAAKAPRDGGAAPAASAESESGDDKSAEEKE